MSAELQRDSLQEAADKAGASLAEFKMWLIVHAHNVTPQRWSKWTHGIEPVPDKYVIEFLREKMSTAGEVVPDAIGELLSWALPAIERIQHSTSPLRAETLEHLRKQIQLLSEAVGPPGSPPPKGEALT